MKQCSKCKIEKPISDFTRRKKSPDGHRASCRQCDNLWMKAYRSRPEVMAARKIEHQRYQKTPKYRAMQKRRFLKIATDLFTRAGHKQSQNKYLLKSPRHALGTALYQALKRRPTENPATIDDLMNLFHAQMGRCALSGIQLTWRLFQRRPMPTSISIDRIDCAKGYTINNLRLICHAINAFRGRMSDPEMFVIARAIVAKADAKSGPTWKSYVLHSEVA